MIDMVGDSKNHTERQKRAWAREKLLQEAAHGRGIREQLMIGSIAVENGLTFEAVRNELFKMIEEGFIAFDNGYRPRLTDKGREELGKQ